MLTSKANAHSITAGDMILSESEVCQVDTARLTGDRVRLAMHNREGQPRTRILKVNTPIDRVIGARSGGQI